MLRLNDQIAQKYGLYATNRPFGPRGEENVQQSMAEIRARSPYLAKALDAKQVALAGAIYDVATGKVTFLVQ